MNPSPAIPTATASAGRVLLLTTGGTIAQVARPDGERTASGEELLAALPPDRTTPQVVVEHVTATPSWDLDPDTMVRLALRARDAVLDQGFAGVVITHGTDTLEETAFLTDLLAGAAAERGGIVLTGAMRRQSDLSSDGPRNLLSSLTAAADPRLRGAGAVVCLNDELHAARWVHKVDATSIAAFSSAPFAPLGRVVGDTIELLTTAPRRPPPPGPPQPAVALIKTYPGIPPALLHSAVAAGARGIVLEGVGTACIPSSLFETIADLTHRGIPVVVASRCRTRAVPLAVLPPGDGDAARFGAVGAGDLSADKARTALMVALGADGADAARTWFEQLTTSPAPGTGTAGDTTTGRDTDGHLC